MQGFILEVSISPVSDELDTAYLAGATVITLVDPSDDFSEDGGQVEIVGEVYDYTSLVVDEDNDTAEMTLATGLVEDMDEGTGVVLVPYVREKWAMVEARENDDVILALVPHHLYDRILDGVRDPEGQEAVNVEQEEGDWVVTNVLGSQPLVSGEYTDPDTAQTPTEVGDALDELQSDVATHTGQLGDILGDDLEEGRLQNVEEVATSARNLANTADGRVSMSDYEPAPEDAQYFATSSDGGVILDENGDPVLLNRTEGSVWFVRTRSRNNLCDNPSFEVGVSGWATSELTMSREAEADAPAGAYVLRLTNNTAPGEHVISWDAGASPKLQAVPGAEYTWSVFAEGVSGDNTGVVARLEFFDALDASLAVFDGVPVDLTTDDWSTSGGSARPYVTAEAPADAVSVVGRVVHPSISSVWRIDGGLLEFSSILGRYFDGTWYDASWVDAPGVSQSTMAGGKILKMYELDDGAWIPKVFNGDVLVDLNASQITRGYMDGDHILDRSVPLDKISGSPITAAEDLLAGQIVHVFSDMDGQFRVQLASANDRLSADGFVLEDVLAGGIAYVYSYGYNPFAVALSPGAAFLSTEAGSVASAPPQDVGTMVQRVGASIGPTVLNFSPANPIYIT